VGTFLTTLILVILFQVLGLVMLAATPSGFSRPDDWARLFVWTLYTPSANLVAGCVAGAVGMSLSMLERRLKPI
jgi:hypothetical protein